MKRIKKIIKKIRMIHFEIAMDKSNYIPIYAGDELINVCTRKEVM